MMNIESSLMSMLFLQMGRDSTIMLLLFLVIMIAQKHEQILECMKNIMNRGLSTISMEGRFISKVDTNSSEDYPILNESIKAVLHYIRVHVDSKMLNTMKSGRIINGLDRIKEDYINLLPNTSIQLLTISEHINMSIYFPKATKTSKVREEEEEETCQFNERSFTLTLTTTKSISYLNEFITNCITEFNQYEEMKAEGPLRIFRPTDPSSKGEDRGKSYELITDKTFDNLFFEGKDALIKRLDSFKDKTTYQRLGIQDALGLLFHGEPGTGKTSTIKAIAKYMNMHLIIVPMNQIKTKRQLEDLFHNQHIAYRKVPTNKRIYVFEEIDCNGWDNVVLDRSLGGGSLATTAAAATNTTISTGTGGNTIIMMKEREDRRQKDSSAEEPMSLGALLECMDGLLEQPGRIIIMTTNHPERLDPALRRPGRLDMEIEFKRLTHTCVAQIFEHWYGIALEERVPDYKYTQAEISQIIFRHLKDPEGFIREVSLAK